MMFNLSRGSGRVLGTALAGVLFSLHLTAARLASRVFTSADGLGADIVRCIVPDSKGFLWFCTGEGVSRYDGYQFVSYGVAQGLAHRSSHALLETRAGTYLVATDLGISRLDASKPPTSAQRFVSIPRSDGVPASRVYALLESRAGVVWGATVAGLYRIDDPAGPQPTAHFISLGGNQQAAVTTLVEDRYGSLWVGSSFGLCRLWFDKDSNGGGTLERSEPRVQCFDGTRSKLPADLVNQVIIDQHGTLWAGALSGLWKIHVAAPPNEPELIRRYDSRDGLASSRIHSLVECRDGEIWIGTSAGLDQRKVDGEGNEQFLSYGADEGLSGRAVAALSEDAQGALWAGVDHGLSRIERDGFATFTEKEGVGRQGIVEVHGSGTDFWAVSNQTTGIFLHHLVNQKFVSIRPRYPPAMKYFGWGSTQIVLHDREGDWWIATGEGLCRFSDVDSLEQLAVTAPSKVYTTRDGLPANDVFRLFEDARGDIWITTLNSEAFLSRWDRGTKTIQTYKPSDCPGTPTVFAEDHDRNLWIGCSNEISTHRPSGLLRYRAGTFEWVPLPRGGALGWIVTLYIDHNGAVLAGTTDGGVGRIEHPGETKPQVTPFLASPPLASNSIRSICEDRAGYLYVGTVLGVDRIDPGTHRVRHYTSTDGLASGPPSSIECDQEGRVWVGTSMGLSLLVPATDATQTTRLEPPRIFITGVAINGESRGVAEPGIQHLAALQLQPAQTRFHVDFVGIGGPLGEPPQYQYKLEGVDPDWSIPSFERGVTYGGLRAGRYRFLVRSAAAGTLTASAPADIAFEVLPPIWQRWWFLVSAITMVVGFAFSAHRYDLHRRLELERVRLRIAADLHDDLGAGLTRMTILTEVVRQQTERVNPDAGKDLSRIAEMARGMVDALGELVWSVDPRRDDMASTVRRIRRYATDVLEPKGIAWTFEPPALHDLPALGPDQRRHLLLIFQEALRNAATHSQCSSVDFSLTVIQRQWVARIRDNGRGLPDPVPDSGSGLRNLRDRAAALGGQLSIVSAPGEGTGLTLSFSIPPARYVLVLWARGRMNMLFRYGSRVRSNRQ